MHDDLDLMASRKKKFDESIAKIANLYPDQVNWNSKMCEVFRKLLDKKEKAAASTHFDLSLYDKTLESMCFEF